MVDTTIRCSKCKKQIRKDLLEQSEPLYCFSETIFPLADYPQRFGITGITFLLCKECREKLKLHLENKV